MWFRLWYMPVLGRVNSGSVMETGGFRRNKRGSSAGVLKEVSSGACNVGKGSKKDPEEPVSSGASAIFTCFQVLCNSPKAEVCGSKGVLGDNIWGVIGSRQRLLHKPQKKQ